MNTRLLSVRDPALDADAIAEAARVICAGGLVAFPTETVYGLGANARDAAAVTRIFAAKERPATDPCIVHIAQRDELDGVAVNLPPVAVRLVERFFPGALTLVLQRHPSIAANVSAGLPTVAVRMPSHPVAHALIAAAGVPIAAPSANRFSRPSATSAQHVLDDLDGRIDLILDGGTASIGVESTILDLTSDPPVVLRPGGVPLEALRDLLPDVRLKAQYLDADHAASAPGQLLKHYAPRAELRFYIGQPQDTTTQIALDARALAASGRRVGLLLPDEDAIDDPHAQIVRLGASGDLEQIALVLFERLRQLDALHVDVILARDVGTAGLGLAIRDRLIRAANGQVILL
jgi:L-threonylcarbamoyladenylate synthase